MEAIRSSTRAIVGIVVLSVAMLFTLVVPAETAEASAFSGPCPRYSIQDVFADPNGNWDGDQVKNSDELYNNLNPCVVDTTSFCGTSGNALCTYPTTYRHHGYIAYVPIDTVNNPCHRSTFLFPHEDYDRDGVSNATEVSRDTDPCIYNAPVYVAPTHRVACPHYTLNQVTAAPHFDWDGDGVTNLVEWNQGTNPCVFNGLVHVPRVHVQVRPQTHRLPHVVNTYRPAPTPRPRVVYVQPPARTCPAGYPYFHAPNGQCYANPVRQLFS